VLLILIIPFVLGWPQALADEKYCNGVTVGCEPDEKSVCANTLQNLTHWFAHCAPRYDCYCNTETNQCEKKIKENDLTC